MMYEQEDRIVWLCLYINQHHPARQRGDIDHHLLTAGWNPAELQAAWKLVLSGQLSGERSATPSRRKTGTRPDQALYIINY
jgi:hypothetical protein